jgi:hypothetical protein
MPRRTLLVFLTALLGVGLAFAGTASAKQLPVKKRAVLHTLAADDEVVLPSRVANAIGRAQNLVDAAGLAIDTGDTTKATLSLKSLQTAVLRADRAARRQMNAPADPNAETTPGPDSVIAVLTLEQSVITSLAGLFDTKSGAVVDAATHTLFATMNTRDKLLNAVIALPAEGAGADYADGMADTVAGYDDEVANLTEALADDTLSAGGKKVLTSALAQSKKTDANVNAAFGGGE